jgi:prophage regulatory protein
MKLIKLPEVLGQIAKSRSTFYNEIHEGVMTPPVKIGGENSQSVAWPEYEIKAINAARIAGRSDAEIRTLVTHLVADRQTVDGRAVA